MGLRDAANRYRIYHSPGDVFGWARHLFSHVHDNIKPNQRQRRLKQAKKPGHPVRPAGLVVELREDKVGCGLLRHSKQNDADDQHSDDGPVY